MRIGVLIARIGGVDGVGLETEKWIDVLERMGCSVAVLTGDVERELEAARSGRVTILDQLGLYHPFCVEEQQQAFFEQSVPEAKLTSLLEEHRDFLSARIEEWAAAEEIDCLISQNASALPCHLSFGMAIAKAARETGIPTVLHLHDFFWERPRRYRTRYSAVRQIMKECFPPVGKNIHHVVINSYNRKRLKEKLGVDATMVPNVMDFDAPFGRKDDYNADLIEELGLDAGDIILSQVTRIVARKGIETAIELVERLDDPLVRLLITGLATDDPKGLYYRKLVDMVEAKKLSRRVLFVGDRVDRTRGMKDGRKVYSLSDVYAHTDACTYFSTYEGFGNAFVEACAAKTPIFVNDYEPVYWPDIGSIGFDTVMLEQNVLTDEHVNRISEILHAPALARRIAKKNHRLARSHFSFDRLESLLCEILSGVAR